MTPTKKQTEQLCNPLGATLSGAGIWGHDFDLERFLDYIPTHQANTEKFRIWVDGAVRRYLELINELSGARSEFCSSRGRWGKRSFARSLTQ
jgi:hypothetical protein